jgi:hypothetical protein
VSAQAPTIARARVGLERARRAVARGAAVIEAVPVPAVLGSLVAVEWLSVLALARTVRHAGWIYYQGGDQLWYYTLGWLLGHGQLGQAAVGYGWPAMLAPVARIAGPNLVSALPAIILFNVLVLLPVAMLALYGIAARIGGRLFGYWVLLLWIAVPFIGIAYTNVGYHQRYTELLLPQGFGLTALADFPTMVAALVSSYFCARVVFDDAPSWIDGVAAGVAAGAAIAIKPSAAVFLAGPALAFMYRRRFSSAAMFLAGVAPATVALAVWKERGLGHLPLLNGMPPHSIGAGLASGAPIVGIDLGRYFNHLNWSHLGNNLDLLREHFWSGRVLQWLVVAGVVGLARRSRSALLLVGGTFAAFAIVKGSYPSASIEDGSLFRVMMPAFPAFILLLGCVPVLLPHAPQLLRPWRPGLAEPSARIRRSLMVGAVVLSAFIPLGAFAAANTGNGAVDAGPIVAGTMPVPQNIHLGLAARVSRNRVVLRWNANRSIGGPVFYRIWRGPGKGGDGFTCQAGPGARLCFVSLPEVGVTRSGSYVDHPGTGAWIYRIAVAANWLDDPGYGDTYLVSRPLRLVVR